MDEVRLSEAEVRERIASLRVELMNTFVGRYCALFRARRAVMPVDDVQFEIVFMEAFGLTSTPLVSLLDELPGRVFQDR